MVAIQIEDDLHSPGIIHWLDGIEDGFYSRDLLDHTNQWNTCKRMAMDDEYNTPRAKRQQRVELRSPQPGNPGVMNPPPSPHLSRSTSSITTTSRPPSPTKRQRDTTFPYSEIGSRALTTAQSRQLARQYAETYPLLQNLLDLIEDPQRELSPDALRTIQRLIAEAEEIRIDNRDENAISYDLVHPILTLAKEVSVDTTTVSILPVQAIDVFPKELLPDGTLGNQARRVDFAIGLTVNSNVDLIHNALKRIDGSSFVQSNQPYIRTHAMCSYIEVKANQDILEGRAQLATWCAAGFNKQYNLWRAHNPDFGSRSEPHLAPIPVWFWVKTQVSLWIAVRDTWTKEVKLLDIAVFDIGREDTEALTRLVRTISAVMRWGEREYVPWFLNHMAWDEVVRNMPY